MNSVTNLILLFFIYSFIGWCVEIVLKYIQLHRFVNRGFFVGPICPIYGSGAVLITLAIGGLARYEYAYGTTFVLSLLICGTIEFLTSLIMEKTLHARWWDYSNKPMNLNGRIWIGGLALFGFAGVAITHFINPFLYGIFVSIPLTTREIVAGILVLIFAIDYVLMHFMLKLIKVGVESSKTDNTEEIKKEVYFLLSNRSILYKRFANAYPDVIYYADQVNAKITKVKDSTKRLKREAKRKIKRSKKRMAAKIGLSKKNQLKS